MENPLNNPNGHPDKLRACDEQKIELDSVALLDGFSKIITWIPRSKISWYNINSRVGGLTYRVGEATYNGSAIYIFDHLCFQWAEHCQLPTLTPYLR
jgi:hypothetical protein